MLKLARFNSTIYTLVSSWCIGLCCQVGKLIPKNVIPRSEVEKWPKIAPKGPKWLKNLPLGIFRPQSDHFWGGPVFWTFYLRSPIDLNGTSGWCDQTLWNSFFGADISLKPMPQLRTNVYIHSIRKRGYGTGILGVVRAPNYSKMYAYLAFLWTRLFLQNENKFYRDWMRISGVHMTQSQLVCSFQSQLSDDTPWIPQKRKFFQSERKVFAFA